MTQNNKKIFTVDMISFLIDVDFALYKTRKGRAMTGNIFVKKPSAVKIYPLVFMSYTVKRTAAIRRHVGNASNLVRTKYAVENAVAKINPAKKAVFSFHSLSPIK